MKPSVVSLFSGGGGLDLGFQNIGFDIVWAIDNDKDAVYSYQENLGEHILLEDISNVKEESIPKADIVIGGPPCQSFSLVGKRRTDDERGQLVWQYLRIINKIKPKLFVFENVIGLKSAKTSEGALVINDLILAFNELGYNVKWKVLNAADYGVPQRRKRIFLVGTREGVLFNFPKSTHNEYGNDGKKKWVSVEEALGDLSCPNESGVTEYSTSIQNDFQAKMRKNNSSNYVADHITPNLSELDKEIISHIPVGGNYMNVPDSVPSKRIKKFKETGGRTTCYGRLSPDMPSYTINTHFNRPNVGCNIHYKEKRLISIREALRLQSFPDDYKIKSSTKRGKHTVVGNAVPPILSEALAEKVMESINSILEHQTTI
ncbi:DNA cytosine methyltransferase [Virgibacillus halodenitrificans]|uniref:DNA cytosine methyltransferase n=1 Tax=Virgibacillus halodenitrificans TaxID=1482 RepID=UPI0024C0E4A7|nr:DNA cytosine methyltransferase [Virgibacillus halodenitrificans]WHX25656.1 DNA cytosine methyltransferase [Virgibacillus halodenitrificans]